MRTHACPTCGHLIKHDGDLFGPVVHRPDGSHQYTVSVTVGYKLHGAEPKQPEVWAGQELPTHLDA